MGEELAGKVAIVTGGAGGIGAAIAEEFVTQGAQVVIGDMQAPSADAIAFRPTDVADPDAVQALVDFAVERFGGLHVLVNNAGVASAMTRFLNDDLSDFRRVMDVNVLGVLLGSQRAARHMKDNGGGSIINIASTAGVQAGHGLISYRASKAAVIHVSRSIALDVAQYGIRVNCIVPGQIRTPMNADSYDMDAVMKFTQPLPRKGQVEDVAEAAVFLASDRSAQITGVVLPVDGGTTAGPPASQLKQMLSGPATSG